MSHLSGQCPQHKEQVVLCDGRGRRARAVRPGKGPASGTIIAQGGAIGGWSFYAKDGKAKFTYNLVGLQVFTTEADEPVPPGKHRVRAEFAYDGGAKGGDVSLYYDGEKVGEGRVEATQPFIFSSDEGLDIGRGDRYHRRSRVRRAEQRVLRRDQLGRAKGGRRRPHPHERPGATHPCADVSAMGGAYLVRTG